MVTISIASTVEARKVVARTKPTPVTIGRPASIALCSACLGGSARVAVQLEPGRIGAGER